jgi:uncharacterized protein
MNDFLILGVAALLAGVLNTIAGGGTFLTFPALVFTGVSPVAANATSAVAVFPGYLGGAIGFRRELAQFEGRELWRIAAATVLGGVAGSSLLLVTSEEAFSALVPFLLALATLVFAVGDRLREWAERRRLSAEGVTGVFLVSAYGGYFNGGLGIVLLALFSLWGMRDINEMNGLKNGLSFLLSTISVIVFSAAGIVAWPHAVLMMIFATLGGYAGAPLARALPKAAVRAAVVVVGAAMSVAFFAKTFA